LAFNEAIARLQFAGNDGLAEFIENLETEGCGRPRDKAKWERRVRSA
jgi:hypothetical protein